MKRKCSPRRKYWFIFFLMSLYSSLDIFMRFLHIALTKRKLKIYVGCKLTNASSEFIDLVASVKAHINSTNSYEVIEFLGLEEGTQEDVVLHDTNGMLKSDICLFFVENESSGMGIEIGLGIPFQKPVIVLIPCKIEEYKKISRMVTGQTAVNARFVSKGYSTDNISQIVTYLDSYRKKYYSLNFFEKTVVEKTKKELQT